VPFITPGGVTLLDDSICWGPVSSPWALRPNVTITTVAFSDALRQASTILYAPKAGTINRVGILITAATALAPPAYNWGIVTVDAAGRPTAVPFGGSALESFAPPALGTGWLWVTLSTPAVVAAGDLVAARVAAGGTAPDGTHNFTGRVQTPCSMNTGAPSTEHFTAAWIKSSSLGVAALYDDDTPAIPSVVDNQSASFNTGSNPNEIGALLSLPFPAVCSGAFTTYSGGNTADFKVTLYDDLDNVLGTQTVDTSQASIAGLDYVVQVQWDPVVLKPATNYRLTIAPTTANNMRTGIARTFEATSRAFWPEGARWQRTSRAAPGAWAQDPLQLPMMGLMLSNISVPG